MHLFVWSHKHQNHGYWISETIVLLFQCVAGYGIQYPETISSYQEVTIQNAIAKYVSCHVWASAPLSIAMLLVDCRYEDTTWNILRNDDQALLLSMNKGFDSRKYIMFHSNHFMGSFQMLTVITNRCGSRVIVHVFHLSLDGFAVHHVYRVVRFWYGYIAWFTTQVLQESDLISVLSHSAEGIHDSHADKAASHQEYFCIFRLIFWWIDICFCW